MRVIEVSDEVFRELQNRAEPFVDTPEDVIRRLLLLTPRETAKPAEREAGSTDLVSHSGRVPNGAKLRATYKGREFLAEVANGRIHWNGRVFDSLSRAAIAVIQSTGTPRPTENGWRFWEVQDPTTGAWKRATEYQNR